MNKESLPYLLHRLNQIGKGECLDAADLVQKVLSSNSARLQESEAEHALFHSVWNHLSNALDHEDFDVIHAPMVSALESEMAGKVLTYRLAHGWLTRSAIGPTEFRTITEFI